MLRLDVRTSLTYHITYYKRGLPHRPVVFQCGESCAQTAAPQVNIDPNKLDEILHASLQPRTSVRLTHPPSDCTRNTCSTSSPGKFLPEMLMMSAIVLLVSAVSAQDLALAPTEGLPGDWSVPQEARHGNLRALSASSSSGEARHLVVLGAILAAACVFSGAILGFLLLASVAGLAMPLMGALPSTSAAFFAVQVLAALGSADMPAALRDLALPLGWMAPQPDSILVGCILVLAFVWLARRTAVRLHRKHLGAKAGAQVPHGLSPGSWELRALGLVAFPLAAASMQLVASLDQADSAMAAVVVSTVILCFLANQAALAFCFVRRVLEEGEVLRTTLPVAGSSRAGGQEIFIDKLCDELRALPLRASQPGQEVFMSEWLGTAGWCVAPPVALIEETEWTDEAHETFRERMAHSSPDAAADAWRRAAELVPELLPCTFQLCHVSWFWQLGRHGTRVGKGSGLARRRTSRPAVAGGPGWQPNQ